MSFLPRAAGMSLFALASCLLALTAAAQAPQFINYQGRLLNGTNLVNGSVGLSLRLFDASSGGTKLYEDSNTVTVADGLYSTFIGDDPNFGTLTNALTNAAVYVEVAVNGVGLVPRERIGAVAYTLLANGVGVGAITTAMLAEGAVTSNKLSASAVTTASLADGAVSGTKIATNTITTANVADGGLLAQDFATVVRLANPVVITNPAPAVFDSFGYAVAGVGTDRFVVGAAGDSAGAYGAGSAYLYDLSGSLLVTITNPAPAANDAFGCAVAGVGTNRFVVGAYYDSAGAAGAGSAYLYDFNGNLLATITNPAPAAEDFFGYAVAGVGTDRFVVATTSDDAGAANAGSAYLYDFNGNLLATITNPAPAAEDFFGYAVAGVGTDRFVVAAAYDSAGAAYAGSAYLYDLNGNLLATITNPAPAEEDLFGTAVTGVGTDRFVVAATSDDAGAANAGSAYLYDLNGNLLATITNPAPAANDQFGYSVASVGYDRFVVGATSDDAGAANAGSAYLYDLNGNLLATITNPAPAVGDTFGSSVAGIGADRIVVGALYDDAGAPEAGSAYLYSFAKVVPGLVSESVAPGSVGIGQLDTTSVDVRYVLKNGDTMSGALTAPAFSGDGAGLTNIGSASLAASVATNITARLASSVWAAADATTNSVRRIGDTMSGTLNLPAGGLVVGVTQLVAAANGGIGIGMSNPTAGRVTLRSGSSAYGFEHTDGSVRLSTYLGGSAGGGWLGTISNDRLNFFVNDGSPSMTVNTNGNVGIGTTNPTNKLHVVGTVQATAYITGSDRNAKENIAPVSADEILAKVSALPIATWTFKNDGTGTHLGPMAQDFRATFGLGNTDSGIFTVDADGVALAAIQALKKDFDQQKAAKDAKIADLEAQLGAVLERLRALEAK